MRYPVYTRVPLPVTAMHKLPNTVGRLCTLGIIPCLSNGVYFSRFPLSWMWAEGLQLVQTFYLGTSSLTEQNGVC